MKFLSSIIATVVHEREMRRNMRALLGYLAFLTLVIVLYAVLFQLIMIRVEGQVHSWLSGLYWTLVTMTTLGFGDIIFHTDLGRSFSVVVLLSGVVLLLIVLPFTFIRFVYAPWLEAQVRLRAPRRVPADAQGHIIVARFDTIVPGLIERLRPYAIPYFVVEPDPAIAARMVGDRISVVAGDIDSRTTYEALQAGRARMVVANCEDTTNTNITLTVREVAPDVPVVAIVEDEDSIDIVELAGATHVLPLKQRLGENLASRIDAGRVEAHVIGAFRELQIAEMPVRNTTFAGQDVRATRLREATGLNIVGLWERGRLLPAYPHTTISPASVVVLVGTAEQMAALTRLLPPAGPAERSVLVIGGGRVGRAAARALKRKGISVHILDREPHVEAHLSDVPDRLFIGDAADRDALMRAGLAEAPTVLLTTNDDAMNIYLAVYCRRLRPDLRIVSRITHERNLEAIHRAGADFVLSYASLGVEAIFSLLQGHEPVVLGEGVDFFSVPVPRSLAGRTLAETGIGSRTGLSVVAVQDGDRLVTSLSASMPLVPGAELLMLGSAQQRQTFTEIFEEPRKR